MVRWISWCGAAWPGAMRQEGVPLQSGSQTELSPTPCVYLTLVPLIPRVFLHTHQLLSPHHTQSSASSSWRLWPFTGWREPSGSSKQQGQLAAHGSSPTSQSAGGQPSSSSAALQQHPPAVTAGGSASATALQPSGGSFTNLRVLLAPGSKSAPGRADHSGGVEGGAAGEEGEGSMGGVGVGAGGEGAQEGGVDGAGRTQSFAGSPPRPR